MIGKRGSILKPKQSSTDRGRIGNEANFNRYEVKWNPEKTFFSFQVLEGIGFYGWWRKSKIMKTETEVFCVDMYAKYEDSEGRTRDYTIDSIPYDTDPRISMSSLNADICAACNRWFHHTINGNSHSIETLQKQADHPTVRINRIETIDRLLMKLREVRDTAISAGGTRIASIEGDERGSPTMTIIIDVTPQAIALEGRIPPLASAAMDRVVTGERGEKVVNVPDSKNVQALVEQLKRADPVNARKIRATLRSMGHRGGSRSMAK